MIFTLNLQTRTHPRMVSNITYGNMQLCAPLKNLDSVLYISITSLNITKERLLHIFILSQTITNLCFQGSRDKEIDYKA